MTVFLTPEGVPYYAGTYFPPEDRHGLPGFPTVLHAVANAYQTRRGEIAEQANKVREFLQQSNRAPGAPGGSSEPLRLEILDRAAAAVARAFDARNGGVGGAPKFPQPMIFEFLLRIWRRLDDPRLLSVVEITLGTGWCRTSRRCSTTTRSWPACTCTATRRPGSSSTAEWRRRRSTT
jgi:uncharacterized protein YyaL (SSP411 family)